MPALPLAQQAEEGSQVVRRFDTNPSIAAVARTGVLLAALLASVAAAGASAVDERIANVERLLGQQSTAVRQIESNGSEEAAAGLARARDLLERARATSAAGDEEAAGRQLDQATRTMFDAVRVAGTPQALHDKREADFERRTRSLESLLEALDRIGREKGQEEQVNRATVVLRETIARAESLRGAGRVEDGRRQLDAAHELAAIQVESLRGGDTLVRTLTFETKADEYAYELDRNDTHEMLLRVLVEQRPGGGALNAIAAKLVGEARTLREQAEGEAAARRYEAAIDGLERSTVQLIRAIRSAGIYIPG